MPEWVDDVGIQMGQKQCRSELKKMKESVYYDGYLKDRKLDLFVL